MRFIGIDPGKKTGFAVWDSKEGCFEEVMTTTFWEVSEILEETVPVYTVVIEDPSLNRPIFLRKLKGETSQGYNRRMYKIAKNVGQNIEQAKLLVERAENLGYTVIKVRPQSSKKDAKSFKQITGYEGRCSQHARDAAMLVFQMTETKMKLQLAA